MTEDQQILVQSEIGRLRRVLIHSPDSGIGKVVPSKAQDWLFEDIVHLNSIRKNEYDLYVKLLLFFLDPDKIVGKLDEIDNPENDRSFFKPADASFYSSDKLIELELLLAEILDNPAISKKLTASVCAIEGCTYQLQMQLIEEQPAELAKIFISGTLADGRMIFAPIPNFIFTRDIGITINNHILLNKPAKKARSRETLLARYIFFNHPFFANYHDKIIEIPDPEQHFLRPGEEKEEKTTLEGGDVMMVSARHVIIGCSERTSPSGAAEAIKILFERNVVDKASVIKIPSKRDYMHIDTVFTQIKRNMWIMLGTLSAEELLGSTHPIEFLVEKKLPEKPDIIQFIKDQPEPKRFNKIEELLTDISKNELNAKETVEFIYSGNGTFPFDTREQWTDSCNLLAIKEGVVLGYDRNDKTIEAFRAKGFTIIHVCDLLPQLDNGSIKTDDMKNTLILMPSAELSRARGGFHCMSMPLLRDKI